MLAIYNAFALAFFVIWQIRVIS